MTENCVRVEREIAGRRLVLESGQIARQAHGSVMASMGDTQVFCAVVAGPPRVDLDFFPLTVDYREKTDAAGKIPGGFFKREGRPTTKEILTMRLIDRSIRPLFPKGFNQEVQVQARVFGYDGESSADVLAMIAAFAALHISPIPFEGALGAMRIGHLDGRLAPLPTDERRRTESRLDLVVAGSEDAIVMVEASASELPEAQMLDALETAHRNIREICALIEELREKVGKPKLEFTPPSEDEQLVRAVGGYRDALQRAVHTPMKQERGEAIKAVEERCVTELTAGIEDPDEQELRAAKVGKLFHKMASAVERESILEGLRADGRRFDEIRKITIVPNFIRRHHGSALFTRGETQALVSVTLGTPQDEQIIDGIEDEYRKNFYLHYNFPPFSVGEVRRIVGPGRREIGHGMLAERALAAVLPASEKFPYTVRIVSEILESNGSSSMATVCGGCLALMLAGVPITQPVAGIAMGLIKEDDRTVILSDILGSEDHHGDMDFKVAGSGLGITALQMDIKIKGVTRELLEQALNQARDGRLHILREMLAVVKRPSREISPLAPRFETVTIPPEKIGFLIGPGGRQIKAMQEEYQVKIAVMDDSGLIQVYGTGKESVRACIDAIKAMTETPKIGSRYEGTVKAIKDFGAFIEILPGVEGMCHISELSDSYVERVSDVVEVGQKLEVVIVNVDDRGKIKLSHKAVLAGSGSGSDPD